LVHEECIRAFGGVKCAAKREVAGFNIKLIVMLIPVYLWLSAVAAVKNYQNLGQFTSSGAAETSCSAMDLTFFRKPYMPNAAPEWQAESWWWPVHSRGLLGWLNM
jgi:hypothetical protein